MIDLNDCWLYAGYKDDAGYSYKSFNIEGKIYTLAVYRIMYENFIGTIPFKYHIDHLCSDRSCINPEHLEAVPRSVNLARRPKTTGFASKLIGPDGLTGPERAKKASQKGIAIRLTPTSCPLWRTRVPTSL